MVGTKINQKFLTWTINGFSKFQKLRQQFRQKHKEFFCYLLKISQKKIIYMKVQPKYRTQTYIKIFPHTSLTRSFYHLYLYLNPSIDLQDEKTLKYLFAISKNYKDLTCLYHIVTVISIQISQTNDNHHN